MKAGNAILSSFFLSLTTNLFESELPNRVGEATGYNHRAGGKANTSKQQQRDDRG